MVANFKAIDDLPSWSLADISVRYSPQVPTHHTAWNVNIIFAIGSPVF